MNRIKNQRGAALIETAITIPLILLVCVSIFIAILRCGSDSRSAPQALRDRNRHSFTAPVSDDT